MIVSEHKFHREPQKKAGFRKKHRRRLVKETATGKPLT
jgi:hypothetical protein